MALRQLILSRKLSAKRSALEQAEAKVAGLAENRKALSLRDVHLHSLQQAELKLLENWWIPAVRAYLELNGGVVNLKQIANDICPPITEAQAKMIKRYANKVVLSYDADNAGIQAALRGMDILKGEGCNVSVMHVTDGKDPDEFIKSYGEQGSARFRLLLDKSGNDIEYRIKKLRSQFNTDITEQRVEFLTRAATLIAAIENPVERDVYMSKLSTELDVEKDALRQLVSRNLHKNAGEFRRQQQRSAEKQMGAAGDQMNPEKRMNLRAAGAEEAKSQESAKAAAPAAPAKKTPAKKTPAKKAAAKKAPAKK